MHLAARRSIHLPKACTKGKVGDRAMLLWLAANLVVKTRLFMNALDNH